MAVGAGELVGQVAGLRAAFGQIAMLLAGDQGQDRPGRGEAGFGIAIARCVQMDGMRARRQIVQIEGDQHAAIDGGEVHAADRLAFQVLQMGDGMGLLRGISRGGQRQQDCCNAMKFSHAPPKRSYKDRHIATEPEEPESRPRFVQGGVRRE